VEEGFKCIQSSEGPDICYDILNPTSQLLLKNATILTIKFNEYVQFKASSYDLQKTMNITIENTIMPCEIEWKFNKPFKAFYEITNKLIINLHPKCSLQKLLQIIKVVFIDPSLVVDMSGNQLSTPTMHIKTQNYKYISESEKQTTASMGSAFDSSSLVTFGLMIGISLLQSVAIGSFWAFVNMLQILSYLPIIDCFIPYNLELFLTEYLTIKKIVFPFYLIPDFILNPMRYIAAFLTRPLNSRFMIVGYDSMSFIFNFIEELTTWILLTIFYLFLRFLCWLIPESKYFFKIKFERCSYIHKWREEYEYNTIFRIIIECYLNMNFCAFLNIWNVFLMH